MHDRRVVSEPAVSASEEAEDRERARHDNAHVFIIVRHEPRASWMHACACVAARLVAAGALFKAVKLYARVCVNGRTCMRIPTCKSPVFQSGSRHWVFQSGNGTDWKSALFCSAPIASLFWSKLACASITEPPCLSIFLYLEENARHRTPSLLPDFVPEACRFF